MSIIHTKTLPRHFSSSQLLCVDSETCFHSQSTFLAVISLVGCVTFFRKGSQSLSCRSTDNAITTPNCHTLGLVTLKLILWNPALPLVRRLTAATPRMHLRQEWRLRQIKFYCPCWKSSYFYCARSIHLCWNATLFLINWGGCFKVFQIERSVFFYSVDVRKVCKATKWWTKCVSIIILVANYILSFLNTTAK